MNVDIDLWPQIRPHGWKWQRRVGVRGIIWHATRSGIAGRTAAEEFSSTCNWFVSPNNRVDFPGDMYAGMSNLVIGGGRIARAVPFEYAPHYSAGVHDQMAISIEVAQATNETPYDPRDIALCHDVARELAATYGFALGRLPYVGGANAEFPGEVGHEDTAQGRGQGKSDPGALFWAAYLEEEDMGISEEQATAIAEATARRVFDETSGAYFRDLTRKYWVDGMAGDFSAGPDPDVIAAIAAAVGVAAVPPAAYPALARAFRSLADEIDSPA